MKDAILSDGRTVGTTIHRLFCEHMPSAAVASGFVTPVDFSHYLDSLWERFGSEVVKETDLGLTAVRRFLADRGANPGDRVVKAWRLQVLAEVMRIETGGTPRHLPV